MRKMHGNIMIVKKFKKVFKKVLTFRIDNDII